MAKKKTIPMSVIKNLFRKNNRAREKAELEQAEKELAEFDVLNPIDGIERCCGRLRHLIQLDAPLPILENEIRMIRYRALCTLSGLEILKEINARRLNEKQSTQARAAKA